MLETSVRHSKFDLSASGNDLSHVHQMLPLSVAEINKNKAKNGHQDQIAGSFHNES